MKYQIKTAIDRYTGSEINSQLVTNTDIESIEGSIPSVLIQNENISISVDMMPDGIIRIIHEDGKRIIKMDDAGVIYIVPVKE